MNPCKRAERLADRLAVRLGWLESHHPTAAVYPLADGSPLIVLRGTGDGTFGYDPEDMARFLDDSEGGQPGVDHGCPDPTYQDFCDFTEPMSDRGVAIWMLVVHDVVLDQGGLCTPILGDDVADIRTALAGRS